MCRWEGSVEEEEEDCTRRRFAEHDKVNDYSCHTATERTNRNQDNKTLHVIAVLYRKVLHCFTHLFSASAPAADHTLLTSYNCLSTSGVTKNKKNSELDVVCAAEQGLMVLTSGHDLRADDIQERR